MNEQTKQVWKAIVNGKSQGPRKGSKIKGRKLIFKNNPELVPLESGS